MSNENATTSLEKYLADEFCKLWRVLTATDAELQAYKDGLRELLSGDPQKLEGLESFVTDRRGSPALHKTLQTKYAPVLHAILNDLPERAPDTDSVLKALEALED